jgi:hypothetical protein
LLQLLGQITDVLRIQQLKRRLGEQHRLQGRTAVRPDHGFEVCQQGLQRITDLRRRALFRQISQLREHPRQRAQLIH